MKNNNYVESTSDESNGKIEKSRKYMPVLSSLDEVSKARIILRIILVFIAGISIFTAAWIFSTHWVIEGFFVKLTYEGKEIYIPLTPALAFLLLILGSYSTARVLKFNKYKVRENLFYLPHIMKQRQPVFDSVKFRSFASSRLLVAVIFIVFAVVSYFQFGFQLSGESQVGCWFVLGGPSLFIPTATIQIVTGIGLLLYVIFSMAIMRISKSQDFIFIEEYRLMVPWITEIPLEKIKGVRLTNRKSGPKYLWILYFLVPTVALYEDGFHFILNRFAYGYGIIAGEFYLISASLLLFALLFLTLKHQHYLEIITDVKRYELWFSAPFASSQLIEDIERIFGIPIIVDSLKTSLSNNENKDLGLEQNLIRDTFRFRYAMSPLNLIASIIFFAAAFGSEFGKGYYAGFPIRVMLFGFGLYTLIKFIKEDIYRKYRRAVVYDREHKFIAWRSKIGGYNAGYRVNDIEMGDFAIKPRLQKLNVFDLFFPFVVYILIGIDLSSNISLVSGVKDLPGVSDMIITHILWDLTVAVLCILLLLRPGNTLQIKSDDVRFEYRLHLAVPERNNVLKAFDLTGKELGHKIKALIEDNFPQSESGSNRLGRLIFNYKYGFKHQKEAFLSRVLLSVLSLMLGIIYIMNFIGNGVGFYISLGIAIILLIIVIFLNKNNFKIQSKK